MNEKRLESLVAQATDLVEKLADLMDAIEDEMPEGTEDQFTALRIDWATAFLAHLQLVAEKLGEEEEADEMARAILELELARQQLVLPE